MPANRAFPGGAAMISRAGTSLYDRYRYAAAAERAVRDHADAGARRRKIKVYVTMIRLRGKRRWQYLNHNSLPVRRITDAKFSFLKETEKAAAEYLAAAHPEFEYRVGAVRLPKIRGR
jgi:hypothetical protein